MTAGRRPSPSRAGGRPVWAGLAVAVAMLVLVACSGSTSGSGRSSSATAANGAPTAALASQGYVWGQPLVISMRTAQTFAKLFGVNHLTNQQMLSTPASRLVVAPNVDTLYSIAVLDLREGPQVLSAPAIHDRYYTYQFLDMYTESFAYVGTRATGGRAGSWMVVAPNWKGTPPPGATLVRASTPIVVMLGRFLVSGPADLAAARAVMAQVTLAPLRGMPTPGATTPTTTASSSGAPLGEPVGTAQSVPTAGAAFFDELGDDLAVNPPTSAADRTELARLAPLGVGPGRHPAVGSTPARTAVLAEGVTAGAAEVAKASAAGASKGTNGWTGRLDVGRYGADFLLRAQVAQTGWGANIPQEAVYLHSALDGRGQTYSGTRAYVLHFPAGSLPPAQAFWSVTLYGPDRFLVANSTNRYAIGDRTAGLTKNADGSLDLYLQATPPAGHEGNWLPTPTSPFALTLRIYLPEASVLSGRYHVPPVQPTNPPG